MPLRKLSCPFALLSFLISVITGCGGGGGTTTNQTPVSVNSPPIAIAGDAQTVSEQTTVTLLGSGSDSDGTIAGYQWTQTSGTDVVLTDSNTASASFLAPSTTDQLVLSFELQVTDNQNALATDTVEITIIPGIQASEVQMTATDYHFWCSSETTAVAWHDDTIAIVIEGKDGLEFDHQAMSRIVSFFHRMYDKYESLTGLTDLPLDNPWQQHITIQIPLDNCGAGGLASHGVRGISVGRGLFDEQYNISVGGEERYHQVFFYESNRNFWPPEFNESFDWAMDDEPLNWGWWTVGMNNAMAVMMADMLGAELEYSGHDAVWFRDRMVANLDSYQNNPAYDFDYGWRQHQMPWNSNESINDLMSGLIIHSYETWGGENWLRGFYQAMSTVVPRTDVFAYQECRDNLYRIWSNAAGEDLLTFFTDTLRWKISADTANKIPLKYSLADALAGGNGSFPGTGSAGNSVITSLNNIDFSAHNGIVDGSFVPQNEGLTQISSSGMTFDFSAKAGISQNDGVPVKGPSVHTDPSFQQHNLGTNPNYSTDPYHHAFISMHAASGMTYNLDKIRQSFDNTVTLSRFTARFGSATNANINYWVLIDGQQKDYGEFIDNSLEAQDLSIELKDSDTYLTLVIADANTGSINNAHGYIGDPIIYGLGAPVASYPTPVNPLDESTTAVAWQSLRWTYGLGVESYHIYIWTDTESEPDTANYILNETSVIRYRYFNFDTQYYWKIVSNLANESFTSPIFSFFVQAQNVLTDPSYNISPEAQEAREASYTLNGIGQISGPDSNVSGNLTLGFYGDSNTDIIVWQQPLVDALDNLGVTSLNRGINGADAQQLWEGSRNYEQQGGLANPLPFSEQIITDNIDLAIIYIGINDVLNNSPTTPTAEYKSYLNLMVEACVNNNIKVVLVSPTTYNEKSDGSNLYDAQLDEYENAAREVATDWGATFVPARTHFINYLKNNNFSVQEDGTVIHPYTTGILNTDAVHHNAKGKLFLSELVADAVQKELEAN